MAERTTKVHKRNWLDGVAQSTPDDAYVVGSDWKESYCFQVPKDWASGVHIVSVPPEIPDKGKAGKI